MRELIILISNFQKLGLSEIEPLQELLKNAQNMDSAKWQTVLDAVKTPLPGAISTAANQLKNSVSIMYNNAQKLQGYSNDDLKTAIYMAANTPTDQMKSLSKSAQIPNLWTGTKYLGKQTLRALPIIGFIFSFLLALKNFVASLETFATLVHNSEQVGLTWLEVLIPAKLDEATTKFNTNPDKLTTLVYLTRISQTFYDEGISFVLNALDFIKDIIFLFIDVGSFGWLTVADISLSVFFMALEYLAESNTLYLFDDVIQKIVSLATQKLKETSFVPTNIDFDSMDYDQLQQWFSKS